MTRIPLEIPEVSARNRAARRGRAPAERPPSDRVYGRLHWTLIGLIAAIILYGLVVARFLPPTRGVGFRLVIVIVLCFNLLWWSVADRRFTRHIGGEGWARVLRGIVLIFAIVLNVPMVLTLILGRLPWFLNHDPPWYAMAFTLWHLGLVSLMPIVALLRLCGLGVLRLADNRRKDSATSAAEARSGARSDALPTRRALLKTAFAYAPMAGLAVLTGAAYAQRNRFEINRRRLAAPWLPDGLRGLTITHLSDLHLGRHFRPHMLGPVVEAANGLNSDLVMVTGDVVDVSNDFLPDAIDALRQIEHRHGLFLCLGNHDEIDSRQDYIAAMKRCFPLLINERRTLTIGGHRLTVGGLDYAADEQPRGRRPGYLADIAAMLDGYSPRRDGPLIALSHHPHAFDLLASAGVPLTLAGHTHGGQLMLSAPDRRPDAGVGRLLFRYLRGFYSIGDRTLFVNRGIGNWFPLRWNAAAEVVQIQLV